MIYCDDSLGSRVADCSRSGYGISMEQELANARLIAAAPELLAALKAVMSVADSATVEFDSARVAIAKAEGQP